MIDKREYISPLRYPGGKAKLAGFIEDIILLNGLEDGTVYELYAGGAGASLNLLMAGVCSNIVLNDLDKHIFYFWKSILDQTDEFLRLLFDTPVDLNEWEKQKATYENIDNSSPLEVGFSAFFLNRCNRSGILSKAGPIGGFSQTGKYKIDARYNKSNLAKRISLIAEFGSQITVTNKESVAFLDTIFKNPPSHNEFIFLDPPYYVQGENLYLNSYKDDDHKKLSQLLNKNTDRAWLLTYDNSERIHELYSQRQKSFLDMSYSLQQKRKAKEIMVFSNSIEIPQNLRFGSQKRLLQLL